MSSTRLPYDENIYSSYVDQSIKNVDFRTNAVNNMPLQCYPNVSVGHPGNCTPLNTIVEVENDLSNRDRKKEKYLENIKNFETKLKTDIPNTCNNYQSNSLLTHPKSDFRGLSTEEYSYDFPQIPPQNHYTNFQNNIGINSRKLTIDIYEKLKKT